MLLKVGLLEVWLPCLFRLQCVGGADTATAYWCFCWRGARVAGWLFSDLCLSSHERTRWGRVCQVNRSDYIEEGPKIVSEWNEIQGDHFGSAPIISRSFRVCLDEGKELEGGKLRGKKVE